MCGTAVAVVVDGDVYFAENFVVFDNAVVAEVEEADAVAEPEDGIDVVIEFGWTVVAS